MNLGRRYGSCLGTSVHLQKCQDHKLQKGLFMLCIPCSIHGIHCKGTIFLSHRFEKKKMCKKTEGLRVCATHRHASTCTAMNIFHALKNMGRDIEMWQRNYVDGQTMRLRSWPDVLSWGAADCPKGSSFVLGTFKDNWLVLQTALPPAGNR